MPTVEFDYSALRGKIYEKYGSIKAFSKAMNMATSTLHLKLKNKYAFSDQEIIKMAYLLEIKNNEINIYFFKENVVRSPQKS